MGDERFDSLDSIDDLDDDQEDASARFLDDLDGEKPTPPKEMPPMPPPSVENPPDKPAEPTPVTEGDAEKQPKSENKYEVVNEKTEEEKAKEIKEVATAIKEGRFDEKAKQMLLDALNNGKTEGERRRSFNEAVNRINQELTAIYKQENVRDPNKQFQIRSIDVRSPDGNRDQIRIGLQNRRNPNYSDSFTVRLKK